MKRPQILTVRGFRFAGISAGLKKSGAPDLGLIAADHPVSAAGVFTRNRLRAAPVRISEARLRSGKCQAILVNSGRANACTGALGLRDARHTARLAAQSLGIPEQVVCVASTGVIGRPLLVDKIADALPQLVSRLRSDGVRAFSRAILTTDRSPKLAAARSRHPHPCSVVGIAKGAGMIMPQMATMLAFLVTDARVEPADLRALLRELCDDTFNAISVDGDTSTNDSVIVLASGRSPAGTRELRPLLHRVMRQLAEAIVRDGEGTTHTVEISVEGARSVSEARRIARCVATSPLVKTAFFGADPNWGRIACAVGNSGILICPEDLEIDIGGIPVARAGMGIEGAHRMAHEIMRRDRYRVSIRLGRGTSQAKILTSDLSYEYIRINAEYST